MKHPQGKKFQVNKPVSVQVTKKEEPMSEVQEQEKQVGTNQSPAQAEASDRWVESRVPAMVSILEMQASVNTAFNPNWREDAKAHRQVNFLSAIFDEVCETFRSHEDFKFWAPRWTAEESAANRANVSVELVDILHFAASEELVLNPETPNQELAKKILQKAFFAYEDLNRFPFMYHFGQYTSQIAKSISTANLYAETMKSTSADSTVIGLGWFHFFGMCREIDMSFEVLVGRYFAKATLNKFRKANNYKNGTWSPGEKFDGSKYIKNWADGREDNAHLMDFLDFYVKENGEAPSITSIQQFLELSYEEVKASVQRAYN